MPPTEAESAPAPAPDEPAAKKQKTTDGAGGGDDEELHYPSGDDEIWKSQTWANPDGTKEDIIEVEDEPRHNIDFVNSSTKIITIKFPPKDTTLAHRHEKDTIIIILMKDGEDTCTFERSVQCLAGTKVQYIYDSHLPLCYNIHRN